MYKADLTGANLYKANLTEANLNSADLIGTYLCGTKFTFELKNVRSLRKVKYDPQQFPFLALNANFLKTLQNYV